MYVPGEPLLSFSMKDYAAVEKHDSLYHDTFIQSFKTVLFRFADAHLVSRGLHLNFLACFFPAMSQPFWAINGKCRLWEVIVVLAEMIISLIFCFYIPEHCGSGFRDLTMSSCQ